jgi:hypothetical protein
VIPRIGVTVRYLSKTRAYLGWLSPMLALLLSFSVGAYDDVPHSADAIRDAYFLGKREAGLSPETLARYAHWVPELTEGTCTSQARLKTPFLQVAEHAGQTPNYSAQDAVKEFYGKPMLFRIYLDICYKPSAPLNAIKVKVLQNKKEIIPLSSESSPYVPRVSEITTLPANGEQIRLEFKSGQIDSSTLTILIDTPDKQHAQVEFDLPALR